MSGDPPIRVILFTSGATIEYGTMRFIELLEAHPDIELEGILCQSAGQGISAIWQDLWRRRKWLAFPLAGWQIGQTVARFAGNPRAAIRFRRQKKRFGGKIAFVPDIHAPAVLDKLKRLAPDLGLSYGSPILKPNLFKIPKHGTLGIHHGKVPEYRGKKTMFWAMYNGEQSAGVTIQKINSKLDGGDIAAEGIVPIGTSSQPELWKKLEQLGFNLYIKAILEVKNGTLQAKSQSKAKGKLYRDPSGKDILKFYGRRWRRRAGL